MDLLLECSLCNDQYNDKKRRARILICGHYFCQECLTKIIQSATPRCPTCREDISTHSAESLPPNFLMDDLLNKMKMGSKLMDFEENGEDFSAGSCPKHPKCQLYFNCNSHNVNICRDCTVIEHNPSKCQIISFQDELEEMKKKNVSNLKTQKLNMERNISDLQNIITDSESIIKEQYAEIAKLQIKVTVKEQVVKKAKDEIQNCMENKSKIEKIHQELISSVKMNQIKHACQEAVHITTVSDSIETSLKINFDISSKSFQDLVDQRPDEFVNRIIHGKVSVHVTSNINGNNRVSQLLVKDGDIYVPALSPSNSLSAPKNIVTVSSLLTQYPSGNADIYLILAAKGKELGTVHVKLMDNEWAKYVKKLFIGTIGPTYRGAVFKDKYQDFIATGNVGEQDNSSCLEKHPSSRTKIKLQKGSVYININTRLSFFMTNVDAWSCSIGDVVKGINVLEAAFNSVGSGNEVTIKDAGIILK